MWGGVAMLGTSFIALGAHLLMYARDYRRRKPFKYNYKGE